MADVVTFVLIRFWINDYGRNPDISMLIPREIPAFVAGVGPRNVPPPTHDDKLRAVGLGELTKRGRKRPGKRDSGEQIELPDTRRYTLRHFVESMQAHGLQIVSLNRKAESQEKTKGYGRTKETVKYTRHVVTLGIGWGAPVEMTDKVRAALRPLMNGTWQQCHVWDNSAPRNAGVPAIDTVNLTSPEFAVEPEQELVLDSDANLKLLPVGDTQLTLRTPREQLPGFVTS